jgi:hypothetical protein
MIAFNPGRTHRGGATTRWMTRVGVVDSAVLERKDAHTLLLRLGFVDVPEVVVGAVSPLLLGEGGAEVVVEVAPER